MTEQRYQPRPIPPQLWGDLRVFKAIHGRRPTRKEAVSIGTKHSRTEGELERAGIISPEAPKTQARRMARQERNRERNQTAPPTQRLELDLEDKKP